MSQFDLSGHTVLATGAGRGLGRGMALAAAEAGAQVVGVARSKDQLDEVAAVATHHGGRFVGLPWDVADLSQLSELLDTVQYHAELPTGVVHAAGAQLRRPAHEVSLDQWRRLLAVNLEAPFFLSAELARRQQTAHLAGSHVFVSSLTSAIGVPGVAPYSASKSGLLGVMRTFAVEWAEHGCRANAIRPGYYHTELTGELFDDPTRCAHLLSRIPMGRTGEPGDLAGATVFLLAPASEYVTGQVITVDGGWLAS